MTQTNVPPPALVCDNFFTPAMWHELVAAGKSLRWHYEWLSADDDAFGHWHVDFLNYRKSNEAGDGTHILQANPNYRTFSDAWDLLRSGPLTGHELVRCYANAHTYGVEGFIHRDVGNTECDGNYTVIIYLNEQWESNWAGETVFINEQGDFVQGVMPTPNRLIMFEGRHLHVARPPSRVCPKLRMTLMYKTRLAKKTASTE